MKKENLPSKICKTCGRPMKWRKKWEKSWHEVRHCSDRCRRENRIHSRLAGRFSEEADADFLLSLTDAQVDRIIQMAWEDRTTFEAIREQFGLFPGQVIKLMRKHLKPSSFRLWRQRTSRRTTKHLSKRSFLVGRFRCKSQRV